MKNILILTLLFAFPLLSSAKEAHSPKEETRVSENKDISEKTDTGESFIGLTSMGSYYPPADLDFFYVDLDVEAYESNYEIAPLYVINTTEHYGASMSRDSLSNCEIEYFPYEEGKERHPTESLICILDVEESEFQYKDFHISYNVPEGMCKYTSVALPWHFNYPIHKGPVVELCKDDPNTKAEETGYRCSNQDISTCNGTCYKNENALCPGGTGGPSCCVGGKKGDGTNWEPHPECFGGPGTISPQFPIFQGNHITALPKGGSRQTISLSNSLSFNNKQRTTAPYVNYLKKLDVVPEDLKTLSRNELPVFLQHSIYEHSPRLFFEFSCLDNSLEVLHQILLMVREWNTFEEFKAFYDSGGSDENRTPDMEGQEGTRSCAYEETRIVDDDKYHKCNDQKDLADYDSFPKVSYGRWE